MNESTTVSYTGKYYFKRSFLGSLCLYVEVEEINTSMERTLTHKHYKLADEADLNHFKLNLNA